MQERRETGQRIEKRVCHERTAAHIANSLRAQENQKILSTELVGLGNEKHASVTSGCYIHEFEYLYVANLIMTDRQ